MAPLNVAALPFVSIVPALASKVIEAGAGKAVRILQRAAIEDELAGRRTEIGIGADLDNTRVEVGSAHISVRAAKDQGTVPRFGETAAAGEDAAERRA